MPPIISIIVPIYNNEAYIQRCVDSLIKQTLNDIEIILIDDGSTDQCPEICDAYIKTDERIRVIHKLNGGVAHARNIGLHAANSKYVTFVDSDDWIEERGMESFCNELLDFDYDVVIQGIKIDYTNDHYEVDSAISDRIATTLNSEVSNILTVVEDAGLLNSPCNKIYKKRIIDENNICFKNEMPAEDLLFNCDFFKCIDSVSVQPQSFYHYIKRDCESLVTHYIDNYHLKITDYFKARLDLYTAINMEKMQMQRLLNDTLCGYAFTVVANMYRKYSTLSFKDRTYIYSYLFENDTISNAIICANNHNRYCVCLRFFCKNKRAIQANMIFSVLFRLRYKFEKTYRGIRRKMLYG